MFGTYTRGKVFEGLDKDTRRSKSIHNVSKLAIILFFFAKAFENFTAYVKT